MTELTGPGLGRNRLRILRRVAAARETTRGDLLEETGLSLLTVTKAVAELIERGMLIEDGSIPSGSGRRKGIIKVNRDYKYTVGVDIGYHSIRMGVVGFNGELLETCFTRRQESVDNGGVTPDYIADQVIGLIEKYGADRFLGVGVGISGIVGNESGRVLFSPNLHEFDDFPLGEHISLRLEEAGHPLPVRCDSSARCMAIGERDFGAGYGVDDMLFLSIGYGSIAAGIIASGRLYRGDGGMAGEIGHCRVTGDGEVRRCSCGCINCLEMYATFAMVRSSVQEELMGYVGYSPAKRLMGDGNLTPETFAKAWREGDRIVCEKVELAAESIAEAVSGAVDLLNPRLIVMGGGFAETLPELVEAAERKIKVRCLLLAGQRLTVKRSELGAKAPLLGSAMQIINAYLDA